MTGQAVAAAAWWASRLGNCHHDTVGLNIPGHALTVDEMETSIEMNLQAVRGKYTPEQADRFGAELAGEIAAHLITCTGPQSAQWTCSPGRHIAECDYSPGILLRNAARRAGLDLGDLDLPRKTIMVIRTGVSTVVSEGYGAPYETIWTAPSTAQT